MMVYKKDWYKSKAVWAGIVALLVIIVTAAFGETSPLVAIIISVASALGIYGRAKATTELK